MQTQCWLARCAPCLGRAPVTSKPRFTCETASETSEMGLS